jgi:hypothetical protein
MREPTVIPPWVIHASLRVTLAPPGADLVARSTPRAAPIVSRADEIFVVASLTRSIATR